jgi:hypothetical protein
MGRNSASFEKRRKEEARAEARVEKARKRDQRRAAERERAPTEGDPDIDWIVPGPQLPASEDESSTDDGA